MSVKFCQQVKVDGTLCQVPPLNGRHFCHFHIENLGRRIRMARARARREPYHLVLPILEDLASVLVARQQVMDALASGQLDRKLGGTLLYGLQGVARDLRSDKAPRLGVYDPAIDTAPRATDYPDFEEKYDLPPDLDLSRPPEVIFAGAPVQAADSSDRQPAATSCPTAAAPMRDAEAPPQPLTVAPAVPAPMDSWAAVTALTPRVDSEAVVLVPASPTKPEAILAAAVQICRRNDKYPMVTGLEVELEHLRHEDPQAHDRRLRELQRANDLRHQRQQHKLQKARYLVEAEERNKATEEQMKADFIAWEERQFGPRKLAEAGEEPGEKRTSPAWAIPAKVLVLPDCQAEDQEADAASAGKAEPEPAAANAAQSASAERHAPAAADDAGKKPPATAPGAEADPQEEYRRKGAALEQRLERGNAKG